MQLSLFSALRFLPPPRPKTLQLPVGPPASELPWAQVSSAPSYCAPLRAQVPAQAFSVFFLFMSPSSLLPHSREPSLSPWRPGVFCCCPEVALEELFRNLDEFLVYLWGGWQTPHPAPPPSSASNVQKKLFSVI